MEFMTQYRSQVKVSETALALVFVICAIVIYIMGLDNYFVSDDWNFLYPVSEDNTFSDLQRHLTFNTNWFVRPAQWVITWTLFKVGGLNPLAYHLFSLVVHVLNASLLVILALNFLRLIEGVHPVSLRDNQLIILILLPPLFLLSWRHHEAVFWYSSINEPMAAFFRLLSLLCISFWLLSETKMGWLWVTGGIAAYTLALSAKESAFILPAEVILLVAFTTFKGNRRRMKLIPFFAVVICYLVVCVIWLVPYLQTSANSSSVAEIERSGLTLIRNASIVEIILRFVQFLNGNYLGTRIISSRIPLMALEILVLIGISILAIFRKWYLWLFAFLWTMIAAIPYVFITSREAVDLALPILSLGFGDRFLYYSAVGASFLLAVSLQWFVSELGLIKNVYIRYGLRTALILLVAVYLAASALRLAQLERTWDMAGRTGADIVQQILAIVPDPAEGEMLCISNLPDNYMGAYIFRNGINAALYLAYSRDDFRIRAAVQPYSIYQRPLVLDTGGCAHVLRYEEGRVVRIN